MSAANILNSPITGPPAITAAYTGGGGLIDELLYNISPISNQTGATFTPIVTGRYYLQFEMTYDQSFGVPAAGAFAEVTINGASVLTITGSDIVLPLLPSVDRAANTGCFLFELGEGVPFSFDLNFVGWTTPSGCGAQLSIYGPF